MAYIGAKPVNGFFEKQDLTTDGSTTTFTLNTAAADIGKSKLTAEEGLFPPGVKGAVLV